MSESVLEDPATNGTAPQLLVITGLSGAGRSAASAVLEDLGFFVIDNLPCPSSSP